MRRDVQRRVEPRDRLRLAARCRDAEQGRRRRRTEDDDAVSVPGAADAPCRIADGEGGPAGRVDLLQGSLSEVADEPAVWRPEGKAGFLGARDGLCRGGVEPSDPESGLRARFPRGERQRLAVGRERDRLDERLLGKRDRGEDQQGNARSAAQESDREDERCHGRRRREAPREALAALAAVCDRGGQAGLRAAFGDPVELALGVVRGLAAILRVLRQAGRDQAVERRRRHNEIAERPRGVLEDRPNQVLRLRRWPSKARRPLRHLVQQRSRGLTRRSARRPPCPRVAPAPCTGTCRRSRPAAVSGVASVGVFAGDWRRIQGRRPRASRARSRAAWPRAA